MKINISKPDAAVEVSETIERIVKPFGNGSAHIIMPKRLIGYAVVILVREKTGQWIKGFHSAVKRLGIK